MKAQFGETLDKIRNLQYWPCHSGNDDLSGWFMMRYIRLYIYIYIYIYINTELRRETQSNRQSMRPLWFFPLYILRSATTALSTLCQGRLYPHIIYIYIYITFDYLRSRENIALLLNFGSAQVNFFGVLNDTSLQSCGGAGWTLVMKTNALEVLINISTIEIKKALYIGCPLLPII